MRKVQVRTRKNLSEAAAKEVSSEFGFRRKSRKPRSVQRTGEPGAVGPGLTEIGSLGEAEEPESR